MGDRIELKYLEVRPRRAGTEPAPLIILLHGIGSNEHDLIALTPELDPGGHYVSLRAPHDLGPGSYGWFNIDWRPAGIAVDPAEVEASRDLLIRTIPALIAATGADERRVYLVGFSQGAIMSLFVALTRPDLMAGVVAMSGVVPLEMRAVHAPPAALRGLPVLMVHGLYDPVLPVEQAREGQHFLATLPLALTYKEYPMAHQVSAESLAAIVAWFRTQLKK